LHQKQTKACYLVKATLEKVRRAQVPQRIGGVRASKGLRAEDREDDCLTMQKKAKGSVGDTEGEKE